MVEICEVGPGVAAVFQNGLAATQVVIDSGARHPNPLRECLEWVVALEKRGCGEKGDMQ